MRRAVRTSSCAFWIVAALAACGGSDEVMPDGGDVLDAGEGDAGDTADVPDAAADTPSDAASDVPADADADGSLDTTDAQDTADATDTNEDTAETGGSDAVDAVDATDGSGERPTQFVESFENEDWWDPESTAVLDTAGGRAKALSRWYLDDSVASGADGELAVTEALTLPAGTYEYTSLLVDGVTLTFEGDTLLRVNGPFTTRNGARIDVTGALTLIVAGPIEMGCAIVQSTGDLAIHQPTDAGITQECAATVNGIGESTFSTTRNQPGEHGDVLVQTRGGIHMRANGYMFPGFNRTTRLGGNLHIRTYGDIVLEGNSYIIGGNRETVGLLTEVWSESRIALRNEGYIVSHSSGPDAWIRIRSGGGVELANFGFITNLGGGLTEIFTEGDLTVTGESYINSRGSATGSNQTVIVARNVTLDSGYVISSSADAALYGGSVQIDAAGTIHCTGYCQIESGVEACGESGDMVLRANGNMELGTGFLQIDPPRIDETCASHESGALTLRSGGTLNDALVDYSVPEGGVIAGDLGDLGIDATGFVTDRRIARSVPVNTEFRGELVTAASVDTIGLAEATLINADGEVLAQDAWVGATLAPGWRYSVELVGRFFDTAAVHDLRITF